MMALVRPTGISWPVRSAAGSVAGSPVRCAYGGPARAADEVEQRLIDLVGVGPDDRVRAAGDDGGAGVLQQRGEPLAGGLVGQHAILVAVDYQDGDADRGEIAPEVFQAGCDATEGCVGRCRDGHVEAVLPGLVADPAAAQEIYVVAAVHEGLHRRRPVSGDSRD